jgi:cell division protein FtsW
MFLYLVVLLRALLIAHRTESVFGSVLAFGCAFFLIFQALINMAVAVNLFPVTGQPLPLVSMGGTSLWFTSIALGMVLSVSRKAKEEIPMPESEIEPVPADAPVVG